jgi:phosphoglycolate phosphatase-like HAD superfamily hydrolase
VNRVQALLFDLDGTLTRTFYGDDNSYLTALSKQLPVNVNEKYWSDCKHLTDEYVLHHFFLKHKNRKANALERSTMQRDFLATMKEKLHRDPDFFKPIPGAKKLLSELKAGGIPFGIATGGWKHMAEFKLKTAQLHGEYDVVGSDSHETKIQFTQALMERLRVRHESALDFCYIGDSAYDFETAKELNIKFIGVDFKRTGKFEAMGVKKVVPDFSDTQEFLRLLNAQ